jgi:DNA-binding LacI/PurR family transcriptional regulator
MLSVSRPSVRRAVAVMEREGILECNPSVGSIIMKAPQDIILVGYLVQDLQDPFHLELIKELDLLLHRHHGALVALQGTDESRLSKMNITHVVKHHELYWKDHEDRLPTVYTGNVSAKANMVVSDVRSGMFQIFEHLRALGHGKIAYASPFAEQDDVQFPDVQEAARIVGLTICPDDHFLADPLDSRSCEELVGRIQSISTPPSALVCYNDWLAIAVMKAAKKLGLDIPGRLSITGYDDLYVSGLLQCPLTTVRFSRKETAEKILKLLLSANTQERVTEVVETRLIARESTAPVSMIG